MSPIRSRATRIGPTVLASMAAVVAVAAAGQGPPTPSILAVMHRQYTTSRAPMKLVKKEADAATPDWEALREASGRFAGLAEALARNTPTIGDAESWRDQVGRHLEQARALKAAADARDLPALREAQSRIAGACNACHAAHRHRGE